MSKLVKDLAKAMRTASGSKTKPADDTAVVRRIEGGTAWVHIPGGVDETPVEMTIDCKPGEMVKVRRAGGKAWLVGNGTAPPTDDTKANVAYATANIAADNANVAAQAADSAVESAGRAMVAAESAQTSANEAKRSADEANSQATYATNYANNALIQLSTVESVVDALTWISEHSVFIPTEDTTVQTSKLYYIPNNNVLTLTSGTTEQNGLTFVVDAVVGTVTVSGTATQGTLFGLGVPNVPAGDRLWFSGVSGGSINTFCLRYSNGPSSTSIYDGVGTAISADQNLNIFVRNNTVMDNVVFTPTVSTANDGFDYQIVQNPTGNPSEQGWYELSTDEAVKTYVQSHLALTNDGLYVLNDSSAYKMLLANDGTYIQAPNGQTVNQSTANGNVIRAKNGTVIASLGYGASSIGSGVSQNPYFTFGSRKAVSVYNASSSYSVGDLCYRTNSVSSETYYQLYCCITPIVGGEAWNSAHWLLVGTAEHGAFSVVEGQNNLATGVNAHIEGSQNIGRGENVHIEGSGNVDFTKTYNYTGLSANNHIEGVNNFIAGFGCSACHIEGDGCWVAEYSDHQPHAAHVSGYHNRVGASYQTVIGKFNKADAGSSDVPEGNLAFIIGNGTADNARSNALTVDWSGNVDIASGAKYKINGTNLSASDVGAVAKSAVCYANSRVDSFDSDGNLSIPFSSLGLTARPIGILLAHQNAGIQDVAGKRTVILQYDYDNSSSAVLIRANHEDGTPVTGNVRYFAVVFQSSWTSPT